MSRSPDFFRQLNEQLLEQLEEFARQPGRTGDEIVEWLDSRQILASRSAVYRWWQDFKLEDRTRRASEVAKSYLATIGETDPSAITQASLRKFNEMIFDTLASGDELSTSDLMKISIALKTGLNAQQLVNELKDKGRQQLESLKATAKEKVITPEMIESVSKAVFG